MASATSRVPTATDVVGAIVRRELRLASKRRLVRFLFYISLLPLTAMALWLVFKVAAEASLGTEIKYDAVPQFLDVQSGPVLLLALGLGTPIVAQDRAEDVLFLYATRPVQPIHYTLGKLLATALPCAALLLVPAFIMAGLQMGVLPGVGAMDTLTLMGKTTVLSLLIGWGYAGMTVAASALTRRGRWALLLVIGYLLVDRIAAFAGADFPIGPTHAAAELRRALFEGGEVAAGVAGGSLLAALGVLAALVLAWRASREMTP